MVQSKATTVEQYLMELPEERRQAISSIRKTVLDNLPNGYVETMNWDMISYEIPLATYPDTYNGKPLFYVAIASQKNNMAIYMHSVYVSEKQTQILLNAFKKMGVKPNMGKSCIRFTKLEKISLETIGKLVAMTSVKD
jgi:galactose-1-phosphate uridylyltransferase